MLRAGKLGRPVAREHFSLLGTAHDCDTDLLFKNKLEKRILLSVLCLRTLQFDRKTKVIQIDIEAHHYYFFRLLRILASKNFHFACINVYPGLLNRRLIFSLVLRVS